METVSFAQLLHRQLRKPLPGQEAQQRNAPQGRINKNYVPNPSEARPSGVLLCLWFEQGQWHTVLFRRPTDNTAHSGQISFPGGKHEATDPNIIHTALREATEELGIARSQLQVMGLLTPLYIPVSNFVVWPVVAVSAQRPDFVQNPSEVEEIIIAPLAELFNPQNRKQTQFNTSRGSFQAPAIHIGKHVIWGATAIILAEFEAIYQQIQPLTRYTMELTRELLKKLPKAELHCHLDGSMRLDTIWELAEAEQVKLPTSDKESLRKILEVGEDCDSLATYLKPFDITVSVLQTHDALARAAYELAEDCVAENVRYLEIRFAPMLHTQKGLKLTEVLDAVIEGMHRAERDMNIRLGLILCGLRHTTPEDTMRVAELAVAYKNKGVVGFDLAGAEKKFPAKDHIEAFYLIVNNNINTTAHAGEASGPDSIHEALHYINANRIGHGTRLRENGDLLNYVNDHRIPLEMCITSNIQTKAVKTYERHPVKNYFDYGIRVTLNTDNRLISQTTLTDEYEKAVNLYGFNAEEIRMIVLNGFKSAFLPFVEKVKMIKQIIKELETLGFDMPCEYD